ncbi:MAG: hypothetical protein QG564_1813 [Campylobacterota bacterium]|nr:hypothetical protein [Campylobacterota bacterium]
MNKYLMEEIKNIAGGIMDQLAYDWIYFDIKDLKEFIENVGCNPEGVFVEWCDSYFPNHEDAIEVLRQDEAAVYAAFNGFIKVKDAAHIISYRNDCIYDIYDLKDFEKIDELKYLIENIDEFIIKKEKEELENAIPEVKTESKKLKI